MTFRLAHITNNPASALNREILHILFFLRGTISQLSQHFCKSFIQRTLHNLRIHIRIIRIQNPCPRGESIDPPNLWFFLPTRQNQQHLNIYPLKFLIRFRCGKKFQIEYSSQRVEQRRLGAGIADIRRARRQEI